MASPFPPGTMIISCENPYVVEGNKFPAYFEEEQNGGFITRVDLPGICKETVRVWADQQYIYIIALDAKNDPEFDKEPPRKFAARISMFEGQRYRAADVMYVVKDGVLKVMVPADD